MAVAGGGISLTTNATYLYSTTAAGTGIRMLGINSGDVAYIGPIDSGPNSMILNASPSSTFSYFYTGGTEKMRLDGSGRLLIGTTTASGNNLLQVTSDALINGITVGKGLGSVANNTAVGSLALAFNTTGDGNTALGVSALQSNGGGSSNVALGRSTLLNNSTGGSNVAIGVNAGSALTTGSNNTIIGSITGTAGLANTIILGAGTTERLRINDLGNMGINTTNPTARLDIYDGNINLRAPSYATTARIGFGNPARNDDAAFIQYVGNGNFTGYIAFGTNAVAASVAATEKMRIDPDGNLGIGTTSPGYKLDLTSGAGTSIARFAGPANGLVDVTDGTGTFRVQMLSNVPFVGTFSNHSLVLTTNNTERVRIDTAGNVGVGTASPNAASIIDAQSTTKGVRFPNMTTTQKNAIANVAGNVIFDTTLGKLCVNTGSGWQTITSA
jgi:hypothetical protein